MFNYTEICFRGVRVKIANTYHFLSFLLNESVGGRGTFSLHWDLLGRIALTFQNVSSDMRSSPNTENDPGCKH